MDRVKVLVAEDIEATINLYQIALSDQYFEKRFTKDGKEALLCYSEWKPDVIVLDIKMPLITGDTLLHIIRQKFSDTDTAIIMVTSEKTASDVKACASLGIEGYIIKPFDIKKIEDQILEGLSKKKPDIAGIILGIKKNIHEEIAD